MQWCSKIRNVPSEVRTALCPASERYLPQAKPDRPPPITTTVFALACETHNKMKKNVFDIARGLRLFKRGHPGSSDAFSADCLVSLPVVCRQSLAIQSLEFFRQRFGFDVVGRFLNALGLREVLHIEQWKTFECRHQILWRSQGTTRPLGQPIRQCQGWQSWMQNRRGKERCQEEFRVSLNSTAIM